MSQQLYGWRYPDGEIDSSFIEYLPSVVWRERWELIGQHEGPDQWGPYRDFDHWVECMKKDGEDVVPVRIVEVKPGDTGE